MINPICTAEKLTLTNNNNNKIEHKEYVKDMRYTKAKCKQNNRTGFGEMK